MSNTSRLEIIRNLPHDLRIEIVENEFRKDFTESEKAFIANKLKPYFLEQSNRGRRTDLQKPTKTTMDKKSDSMTKSTSAKHLAEVPKTDPHAVIHTKIGTVLGESRETVRKREKVFDGIDENTKKDLDSGTKSLNAAYKETIQKENNSKPIPKLPKGRFNHIVEDPGWEFTNKNIGGSGESGASHKYRTQPTIEIAKIPVSCIAAENAVLYLWTTNQHLVTGSMLLADFLQIAYGIKKTESLGNQKVQSDALSVMQCHGFSPKHIITWHKENKKGWGGYSFNNVTEHLLIGTRGTVRPFGLVEKTIVSTAYKRTKNSHSEKPEEMWQLIEKCIKTQRWRNRKLELNCRAPRKGWHPHGDQITAHDIKSWKKSE